jgi:beta-RFAP synthase
VTSATTTAATVRVTAPARLHLGFLDIGGTLGRRFGSIGLAIDRPATRLTARYASRRAVTGIETQRTLALIDRFAGAAEGVNYAIDVESAIPAHAGLGSGTQLALAVGAAIAKLSGRELSAADLASGSARGARSGVGLAAFSEGGFIVDGGRGSADSAPPITLRSDFPDTWRTMLILDNAQSGVSGEAEASAFAGLPDFPASTAAHICHLVLMRLVPALKEQDIASFGAAISEIQEIVGGHFASKQGGSAWTSPAVGHLAYRMREAGAHGIGQSSWGPTGFAFVESDEAAERLYQSLVEDAKGHGLDIVIARGRNTGARVETV